MLLTIVFVVLIYTIACLTSVLFFKKSDLPKSLNRFDSLDGFRGFLALGVFIHHSEIWFNYIDQGIWDHPNNLVMLHLGQTSVSFFFMITAFLYTDKILKSSFNISWNKLYISRLFRILPLYLLTLGIIYLIVLSNSDFRINTSINEFVKKIFKYLILVDFNYGDINNFRNSLIINSGVFWSLCYEWAFYFFLPILSLLLTRKTSYLWLVIGLFFLIYFFKKNIVQFEFFIPFAGGILGAIIVNKLKTTFNFNKFWISILIIILITSITLFDSPLSLICQLIAISVFLLILLGNDLFGLLKLTPLKFLGEISYSTYLLHGLLLYGSLNLLGLDYIKPIGKPYYYLLICSLTPVLIVVSSISYKYVEMTFIKLGKKI